MNFDGKVLRGAQIAPANATTSGDANTGVVRDVRPVPAIYALAAAAPDFVDAAADQYRTTILDPTGTPQIEYLIWAANTADLAGPVDTDPNWWTEDGYGTIPIGNTAVGTYTDGATKIIVTDNGGRDLGRIYAIVVARGDVTTYDDDGWKNPDVVDPSVSPGGQPRNGTNPYLTLYFEVDEQNPQLQMCYLTAAHLTALGGGLSPSRGDTIITAHYTIGSARFWWSRNDRYEARFSWNSQNRRWQPNKGTGPVNLGTLLFDTIYTMNPPVRNLPVGATLSGDASITDSYATIRLGSVPSASASIPVGGIQVRPNVEVASGYDFTANPAAQGVIGQSNGILIFNPTFIQANAGKTIWYIYKGFQASATGIVGKMTDTSIFLSPIPGLTDAPLLRYGSRKYLTTTMVATDAALALVPALAEGTAAVSATTGKVRLSAWDVAKADTSNASFNKQYLGEDVVYDGVSLSGQLQPTRAPVQLVDQAGVPATADDAELYIPAYRYLPTEFAAADTRRGLGRSGIIDAPDGTGALPVGLGISAPVRPGGDNTVDTTTGRVRQVLDQVSDTIIFTQLGAMTNLIIVDWNADLPPVYRVPEGTAYVAKEVSAQGSRVVIGSVDRASYSGRAIYFLQSAVNPAVYTNTARLVSRVRDVFRFDGTEVFYFAVDGAPLNWASAALVAAYPDKTFFTADEVVADIALASVTAHSGHIVITGTTSVEIGFGAGGVKDLSGATVLGFAPGWRAVTGVDNWLPDSGISLGVYRSPLDLDNNRGVPDLRATSRIVEQELSESIVSSCPYYFLDAVPLQDVVGSDAGVFFTRTTEVSDGEGGTETLYQPLEHYVDVIYRFGQRKFDWVAEGFVTEAVRNDTVTLNLGASGLIAPESVDPVVGGGLYVSSAGGPYALYDAATDYVLDSNSGTATLIQRFLRILATGAEGILQAGVAGFIDSNADFAATAEAGDLLVITLTDSTVVYTVQSVVSGTTVNLTPVPVTGSVLPVMWELREGYSSAVYDPALVADMGYMDFNHLPQESMVIQALSRVPAVLPYKANMAGALASGRDISLRFGLAVATSTNTATLTGLAKTELGLLANDSLDVPGTGTTRFTTGSFSIQVGTGKFEQGIGLIPVATFSSNPANIEYLTVDAIISGVLVPKGRLKFGTSVMTAYSGSTVYYLEEFLPAASLVAGQAEYNPDSGILNLSAADLATHAGEQIYFVERLITEGQKDVAINPMQGNFSTNVTQPAGSSVEVSYWMADVEGRKTGSQITEFLSVFVRSETAVPSQPNVYLFNSTTGHTVNKNIQPIIYIGPIQQGFGQQDYIVDYPTSLGGQVGRITFTSRAVPNYVDVVVSYAVYDLLGGERSFEVSNKPVYRPPFYITAGQSRFGVRGDQTGNYVPGQMFRIGEECFYVKSLKYYPQNTAGTGDVTAINIYPSTVEEVGSRAPGNDVVTVVTVEPVTTVVDPDGTTPVVTTAPAGFMSTIDLNLFPFEPVSQGQNTIIFKGDLTQFAVAGHLLEVGGSPYTIAKASLDEEGSRTSITVTSKFRSASSAASQPTVKLSYRPVYPPSAQTLIGVGPALPTEEHNVIRFDYNGPGQILAADVDYTWDLSTGNLELATGLTAGQHVQVIFTRLNPLRPQIVDGVVTLPRFQAGYLETTLPTAPDTLIGTYTYSSPDTFYFRVVPLQTYMGEVTEDFIQQVTSKQPASGVLVTPRGSQINWDQGRFGLSGEIRNLQDKDRAATAFLEFYNEVIVSFEQVQETIAGGFVGDWDGKFRFWIGHGYDYPTPGYIDEVTGYLVPRLIWTDIVNAEIPGAKFFGLTTDWIVYPATLQVVNGEVTGYLMDAATLDDRIQRQDSIVKNDVDDIVLVGTGSSTVDLDVNYYPEAHVKGIYQKMGDEHRLSRIFPTVTGIFTYTLPGIGYVPFSSNGVYSAGITIGDQEYSTNGTAIAQLRNSVVGDITGVISADLCKRQARGRIWQYCPNGVPANAFGAGMPPGATTEPCVIAVPALLKDVPVRPDTGFPDALQFLSLGGTVADAQVGDPDLLVPGFAEEDQLCWGKPEGTIYPASNGADPIVIYGTFKYTGIFVHEVLYGCMITLEGADGNQIIDSTFVRAGNTRADLLPIAQGDTLFVVEPTNNLQDILPDPPEFSTFSALGTSNGKYREGFDYKLSTDGRLIDITMPSAADKTFLTMKEILGQSPPLPLSPLEGKVEFHLGNQNPLEIPALLGHFYNDSGDYQLPYLVSANTELERFDEIHVGLSEVIATIDPLTHAVYPDEVVGDDGVVVITAGAVPATLKTAENTSPGFGPGKGNVRRYDLLLLQMEGVSPFGTPGTMGIHSVGEVAAGAPSLIEPPRFITPTLPPAPGSTATEPISHLIENSMVFVEGPYPDHPQIAIPLPHGVQIIEDTVIGYTVFDFDTTNLALNDGDTVATGNLNDIWAQPGNHIIIKIIARRDTDIVNGPAGPNPLPSDGVGGQVALTIDISNFTVTVTDYQLNVNVFVVPNVIFGTHFPPVIPPVDNQQIFIPFTGMIPWGPGPGLPNEWFLPHSVAAGPVYTMLYGDEFTFYLDTRFPGASNTAWISEDRLTFNEVADFSFAKKRGYVHLQSGIDLETRLSVYGITVGHAAATAVFSSVHQYVNGMVGPVPIPFSFVPRADTTTVGYWAPRVGAVTERGNLKVMAFEGHTAVTGNLPLAGTDAVFSAIPSNEMNEAGFILSGLGVTASRFNTDLAAIERERWDNRIAEITVAGGGLTNVLPGDILNVVASANPAHPGTHQAGTYLVRHAVDATPGQVYLEASPNTVAGIETGWCPLHFPTVVSFVVGTNTLTISDLAPTEGGPLVGGQPSGWAVPGAATRIYIIRNVENLASSTIATFQYSVISARYTAIALGGGNTGVFTLDTYQDAFGVAMLATTFETLLDDSYPVSGMTYWPINVTGTLYGLPENNCVGFDSASTLPVPAPPWVNWAVYGFHLIELSPQPVLSAATTLTFTADDPVGGPPYIRKAAGTAQSLTPIPATVVNRYDYQADSSDAVYPWVVQTLDTREMTHAYWQALNITPGSAGFAAAKVDCILPGTGMLLGDGVNAGFYAQSGVFLEPTFPRSARSLTAAHPLVVDATHSVPDPAGVSDWDRDIGMRDAKAYLLVGAVNVPDEVIFEVRRIRRFHEVCDLADENLTPLRFAYEIRRGIVTAYAPDNKQRGVLEAINFVWTDGLTYTGTQLGTFLDTEVNVHAGDFFRLLDAQGDVLEEVLIDSVSAAGIIILAAPGLQTVAPVGSYFQVFLKQAPVPHEQSCEELLSLLTDQVVTRTTANWTTQQGGYVPDLTTGVPYATAVNNLYDDSTAVAFGTRGVRKGDLVLIDPAGLIPKAGGLPAIQERGTRPIGDEGVPTRLAPVYVAGTPNPVDDNRGYYRVSRVVDTTPSHLIVNPVNTYAGTEAAPVVFADNPYEYAVYPTVNDSSLKKAPYPIAVDPIESQMALRPTLKRDTVTKSFINRVDGWPGHSIRPFSYKVIRPSSLFSAQAVDLILMMRERILSLIELLQQAMLGLKHGSYYVFQRDEHINDLGSPTDPDLGMGVPSNLFIETIGGRLDVVPYANNSGCLSLLDRRVWIHDARLDHLTTDGFGGMQITNPGDTAYTDYAGAVGGTVLPVLTERIDGVLDCQDRFRQLRYAWLAYRTHRILGTLAGIERFEAELPERLADIERVALLEEAYESTT